MLQGKNYIHIFPLDLPCGDFSFRSQPKDKSSKDKKQLREDICRGEKKPNQNHPKTNKNDDSIKVINIPDSSGQKGLKVQNFLTLEVSIYYEENTL